MRKVGKTLLSLGLAVSMVFSGQYVSGISNNNDYINAATKIALDKKKVVLAVGDSVKLKLKNAKASKVTWQTSNKKVATVSKSGKVKAKKKGTVKITATYQKKKYKSTITIKKYSYGTVSGNISYYFNSYQGYKSDVNAKILLIPKDTYAKYKNCNSIYSDDLEDAHVYYATANGSGEYKINHVASGKYIALVVSHNNRYMDEVNINSLAKDFYPEYMLKSDAKKIIDSMLILFYQYDVKTINVYKGEETDLSHNFPATYW